MSCPLMDFWIGAAQGFREAALRRDASRVDDPFGRTLTESGWSWGPRGWSHPTLGTNLLTDDAYRAYVRDANERYARSLGGSI